MTSEFKPETKVNEIPLKYRIANWLNDHIFNEIEIGFAINSSSNTAEGFRKFVLKRIEQRRFVNLAILFPLLQEQASEINLLDSNMETIAVIDLKDPNALAATVHDNLQRINSNNKGLLTVIFKDNSDISYPVPHLYPTTDSTTVEY